MPVPVCLVAYQSWGMQWRRENHRTEEKKKIIKDRGRMMDYLPVRVRLGLGG